MTKYTELVKTLRNRCNWLCDDAAAAIEALEARLGEAENSVERWKDMYLTKHEPKRGEWIRHPEVKNIYGGVYIECPFCGEKYVVQNVSDEKFCRNCGADLRAKMGGTE